MEKTHWGYSYSVEPRINS